MLGFWIVNAARMPSHFQHIVILPAKLRVLTYLSLKKILGSCWSICDLEGKLAIQQVLDISGWNHYNHIVVGNCVALLANLSYFTWELCKSTTVVDFDSCITNSASTGHIRMKSLQPYESWAIVLDSWKIGPTFTCEICKSITIVDFDSSFTDVGQSSRTCLLIR